MSLLIDLPDIVEKVPTNNLGEYDYTLKVNEGNTVFPINWYGFDFSRFKSFME